MTRKNMWVVVFLVGIGFVLRVMFLHQGALTFGYDQARDAFVVKKILGGDFKILGPPSSTEGLYHGVFYYYFLVLPYLVSGKPIIAAYWTAIFNALGIVTVCYLTFLMTKKPKAGLLAGLLYAVNFEATQYAVWLSNPTIGAWSVPLVYLGLWVWITRGKRWGVVLTAVALGVSMQAEVFLIYHGVIVAIWVLVTEKARKVKYLALFAGVLSLVLSSMIVSEIKFGFRGVGGVMSLLTSQVSVRVAKSLGDILVLYLNQIGKVFAFSAYPGNVGYGGVLVLVLMVLALKKRSVKGVGRQPFLATWMLSHATVVSVGGTSTPFLLVGIGPAVSILLAISFYNLWLDGKKTVAVILTAVVVIGNLSAIVRENRQGQTIFAIQKDMILSNELKAMEYTYEVSGGREFSINTLTSPLWINNVWGYLYSEYGEEKYGYLPSWHGRDQIGQLCDGILANDYGEAELDFLIIEPLQGIPPRFVDESLDCEDSVSEIVEEKAFGEIVVQTRRRI